MHVLVKSKTRPWWTRFFLKRGGQDSNIIPCKGTCVRKQKRAIKDAFLFMAGRTGFEPATEDFAPVTA
jgi:hypothetical protein